MSAQSADACSSRQSKDASTTGRSSAGSMSRPKPKANWRSQRRNRPREATATKLASRFRCLRRTGSRASATASSPSFLSLWQLRLASLHQVAQYLQHELSPLWRCCWRRQRNQEAAIIAANPCSSSIPSASNSFASMATDFFSFAPLHQGKASLANLLLAQGLHGTRSCQMPTSTCCEFHRAHPTHSWCL